MKNIVILGGQGFIGYNLTKLLAASGCHVSVFTRHLIQDRMLPGVDYIEGEFADIAAYSKYFDGIDAVYHLINSSIPHQERDKIIPDIQQDLVPTINLLSLCAEKRIKVIFTSSGGTIYGTPQKNEPIKETHPVNPSCSYAVIKLTIEKYLHIFHQLYGLEYLTLRIANPYGPYHKSKKQGIIDIFLNKVKNDEPINIWGEGHTVRDYIHITDVCSALSQALHYQPAPAEPRTFNIGSGQGASINDILSIIQAVSGKNISPEYSEARSIDIPYNVLDSSLASKALNWSPSIALKDGIDSLWRSMND